ncbi:MAG: Dyp-type peroxidase [Salana multivorans]|uniref:Dyp-type peroxidase n=1 Tax=Salana multivorans TaxID=120377 RepID=UPI00095A59A4|nr:Dyp-type peroxidase [Salana multivorans]MBN8884072.1 Dyp-type peroxidase [Salana multivorans]OJX97325.1 MAG: peroxidase [Micrococcales bacterium 73-15]
MTRAPRSSARNGSGDAAGPSRRQLLIGGAVAGWGAALALGLDNAARPPSSSDTPSAPPAQDITGLRGSAVVPCHGEHQAGVTVAPQARSTFTSLDLRDEVDADALRRLLRILSSDIERLTSGRAALADMEPELALTPSRLTVTLGFGPGLVQRAGAPVPGWLAPLPAFGVDRLLPQWSDGDLLLEVASDDPVTVAHATRTLLKNTRAFATIRWQQHGFRHAYGARPDGATMRNLFGQVDGTVNPAPSTADFDDLVWIREGWLTGGTSLVIRRIAMDLERWDLLGRDGREQAVGRRLADGAPLTGDGEHDEPDFAARDGIGFPVIPMEAHIRRARSADTGQRFYRRAYNYDDPPGPGETSRSGLIFTAFQADPLAQFAPVQRRLDELDLLNEWTTPIGSAVFAIPPGFTADGFVGQTLLGR